MNPQASSRPSRLALRAAVLALMAAASVLPAAAQIDPAARTLAEAAARKLEAARTIRLEASHRIDPALGVGAPTENGKVVVTIRRPNLFHAVLEAGDETREVIYDGREICVMHPALGHHAIEPLPAASIEQFADRLEKAFGFRPPLADMLANDLVAHLFVDVEAAQVAGTGRVGWTRCDRLHLAHDGMIADLWIGRRDKLPRRLLLTYTDLPDAPTWDIRFKKWKLDPEVDDALFRRRPAPDSQRVKMIKR